jgi:ribokinase
MIIVFGALNLDLVAQVPRLPSPGETLCARSLAMLPGGKGANQALAARRAGAEVRLFGHVGNDAFAPQALALLREGGVDLAGVGVARQATGLALIEVDDAGDNTITIVAGANVASTASQVPDALLRPGTTLMLQLELAVAEVAALAQRAHAAGARVILNASPMQRLPESLLDDCDVVVVNQSEGDALARQLGVADITALCRSIATPPRLAAVTLGARGVLYASTGDARIRPSPPVKVVDSVGAGDAFIGALAAALDRGAGVERAIGEGLAAGALACTGLGAQAPLPTRAAIDALAGTP